MRQLLLAVSIVIVVIAASAPAQAVDVGARLPALSDVAWLGQPVDPADSFTVVDLWSPDNPACRAIMPRLTDLQRRHPEVRVIGLTAADRDSTERFVASMGSRVGYAIGVVPALTPYAPPVGAPSALLLDRSGTVLWWGDAMDIPVTLAQALSGTFIPAPLPPEPPRVAELSACAPAAPLETSQQPQTRIVYREPQPRVVVVARPWSWCIDVWGPPLPGRIWVPRPPGLLLAPLPPLFFSPHHLRHW